jgi:hypothetical protein
VLLLELSEISADTGVGGRGFPLGESTACGDGAECRSDKIDDVVVGEIAGGGDADAVGLVAAAEELLGGPGIELQNVLTGTPEWIAPADCRPTKHSPDRTWRYSSGLSSTMPISCRMTGRSV